MTCTFHTCRIPASSHIFAVEQKRHIVERGPLFDLEYTPSATTLFRFSALTFNGHHIHLDKDYARSEGYPGACSITRALVN